MPPSDASPSSHVAAHRPVKVDIGVFERIISASFGALLTNLLTTPLDVVKTRMQSPVTAPAPIELTPAATSCLYYPVCKEADATFLRSACTHTAHTGRLPPTSAIATLLHVARHEGTATLWSGLTPGLIMAVPSTTIYFTAYDELRQYLDHRWRGSAWQPYAAFFAGIISRTATVAATSPLELLRTKAMHKKSNLGMIRTAAAEIRAGGLVSLWRGLAPTLWRDVPFSGIYWLGYDKLSHALRPRFVPHGADPTFSQAFSIAFMAGLGSGAVAATVTTPFDVIKTRRQVQWAYAETHPSVRLQRVKTGDMLRTIAREEGLRGLFAGLGARVAKVAPACAIMIASYELGKRVFARLEHVHLE